MADEDTSTSESTNESAASATDTGQHDDAATELGEGGQKALAAERKARTASERQAKTQQKQLDDMAKRLKEYEDRDKTETDKLTERTAAAEAEARTAQGKLLRYEVAAAKKLPSEWAARLQGSSAEELEADADKLLEALGTQRPAPSYDGGVRQGAPAPTDMNALIRQQAGRG